MKYKGLRLKVTSLNSNFNIKILLEQLPALSGTETCSLKYFSIKLPLWWRTSDNRRRPSNSIRLSFTLTTLASRLMTRSVWLRATLIQKHSHTRWCRVLFLEVLSVKNPRSLVHACGGRLLILCYYTIGFINENASNIFLRREKSNFLGRRAALILTLLSHSLCLIIHFIRFRLYTT